MLKISLMPSGVAAPAGLGVSPSHFSVQVICTCSPGLWAGSVAGVRGVAGVAGLAGVVLSWMSCTCTGRDTGEEDDHGENNGVTRERERERETREWLSEPKSRVEKCRCVREVYRSS